MRSWICGIAILFGCSAFAEVVQVSFDEHSYEIRSKKEEFIYQDAEYAKTLSKPKCNRAMLDQLSKDLTKNSKDLSDVKDGKVPKGAVKVIIDGKSKMALRFTDEGQFFQDVPSKVKTIALTSARVCTR